ncbi:MAG: hypothetical protein KDE27_18760 [Planctomycetes bacterium]|nr:hypothetical protein [Planctomycetota bacterium]
MRRPSALALLLPFAVAATGCVEWFFSGEDYADRSRPVALVETTGGVELGATTEYGILTLGRTATTGPCRVHYRLGPTMLVDDGELHPTGGVFTRADIDLKHQAVHVFGRAPTDDDRLVAMWTPDGRAIREVAVELARDERIEGDVLAHPGEDLPPGAAICVRNKDGVQFVGLVAGAATLEGDGRRFYVYAGVDRVREMLAVPEKYPVDYEPKYRPDGISVLKPITAEPKPTASGTAPDSGDGGTPKK